MDDSGDPPSSIRSTNVQELTLAYPIDTLATILNHIHAPSLANVQLMMFLDTHEEAPIDNAEQINPPLRTLATWAIPTHAPLHFHMRVHIRVANYRSIHVPLLPVIQPLLVLRELRYFYLNYGSNLSYRARDSDFAAISQM